MEEFEAQYEQNGVIYKIIGNAELHYKLQNDSVFATGYIAEYENSLEIASVLRNDEDTSTHKEATTSKENVPPRDTITWSRANTLLLIENYRRLRAGSTMQVYSTNKLY
ncbi:hypothetical protein RN001_003661 [Aquatica leii]|uniref:Uncharacterized protein n=1 Tax=Aquatica leii TaxID=1421715 RepID=A0AAN7QBV7_9COLE|nr:hypothetical protein RN001_003661 [Aquatica leii]